MIFFAVFCSYSSVYTLDPRERPPLIYMYFITGPQYREKGHLLYGYSYFWTVIEQRKLRSPLDKRRDCCDCSWYFCCAYPLIRAHLLTSLLVFLTDIYIRLLHIHDDHWYYLNPAAGLISILSQYSSTRSPFPYPQKSQQFHIVRNIHHEIL